MIFNAIPQTRVPGQYAEFDVSNLRAGLSTLNYKVVILGQGTDAGSATAKQLYLISSADQAGALFGFGSLIHTQAVKFFANNSVSEVWAIATTMDPLATPTNKATGSIQITAAATGDGTLALYVAGERIPVAVSSGDAATAIAAAINAKITADHPNLPVKASVATDTVTFEAKNIGVVGNFIDIRVNYYETDETPAGVTYTVTAMSGGTGDPDISSGSPSVIDQLGDTWYPIFCFPYTDATNLAALETELDRRFGPVEQIDGVAFAAKSATQAALVSWGSSENSKQVSVTGIYDVMQTPEMVAAAICGQVAAALSVGGGAESRPFQTLPLIGINPPREENRFTFTERDALLKNGISTFNTDAGGQVRIERLITTYQTNAQSAPDTTWLDVNTRFTAMFIRYDWVTNLKNKYPRAKLAADATRVGPGQKIITPAVGKAEALARFDLWEKAALVEDLAFFKANLISEKDPQDPNALNWFLPCDFVNQFRVGKTQIGVTL